MRVTTFDRIAFVPGRTDASAVNNAVNRLLDYRNATGRLWPETERVRVLPEARNHRLEFNALDSVDTVRAVAVMRICHTLGLCSRTVPVPIQIMGV